VIALVVPEPVAWLTRAGDIAALVAGLEPGLAGEPVHLVAPWALADRAAWRAAARRVDFARRRLVPARPDLTGAGRAAWPGWPLAELALSAWIGGRADRRLRALFWRRAAVDQLAARGLAGRRDLRAVVAPSGAALRCFALAARRGARRILLEDLPGLRQLQADLDRAAAAHPDCRFLRRYRAPLSVVARQEAEWALADHQLVRGHFARQVRAAAGLAPARLAAWPAVLDARGPATSGIGPARSAAARGTPRAPRVLLAGLAAARHGTAEALALLEARPDVELALRAGEGFEPAALARHPRVAARDGAAGDPLDGVDLVIAPSWCESYPAELALAAARGIPIVATRRAAGFVDLDAAGAVAVEPGDVAALVAAVAARLPATAS
jgi:hypothetical protein